MTAVNAHSLHRLSREMRAKTLERRSLLVHHDHSLPMLAEALG